MKRIAFLRPTLASIPDCLYELPPEDTPRGQELAVSTLWDADADHAEPVGKMAPDQLTDEETDDLNQDTAPLEEIFEFGADIDQDQLVEVFGGSEGERVRSSILQERGTDALAWYVTFHARGVQWGAYIPVSSLFYLATTAFGGLKADLTTRIRIAFRALHQHELFHFAVDYMAAQWEAIIGNPCHKPARALRDPSRGYIMLEEQLANASMIRSFWGGRSSLRARGRSDALRVFARQQPPGYSEADHVVPTAAFTQGCEDLARAYISHISGFGGRYLDAVDLTRFYPLWPSIDWRHCPIHVVQDGVRLGLPPIDLGLFRSVAGIVESEKFKRQLSKLPGAVQAAWERAKELLELNPQVGGLNFKLWERRPGLRIYSVRLSLGHRAHLAYQDEGRRWTALDVGTHQAMGHG